MITTTSDHARGIGQDRAIVEKWSAPHGRVYPDSSFKSRIAVGQPVKVHPLLVITSSANTSVSYFRTKNIQIMSKEREGEGEEEHVIVFLLLSILVRELAELLKVGVFVFFLRG